MPCCDCCCPDGEECCKAPGPDGICCAPERCCGTEEEPVCCSELDPIQFCCGEVCCNEGDTCCGEGSEATCCPEDEYCCDGVCQEEPCEEPECESDEDCAECGAGYTPVAGCSSISPDLKCCPDGSVGWVDDAGDARFGRCLADCDDPLDNGESAGSAPTGYCCDGECSEEECPP
jgi:hypothetical protein